MKKIGVSLLTAVLGGAIAVGGYKLFESKQMDNMTFEEKQKVYYASNPAGSAISSTGNPDFTQAAAAVSPGVVHIKVTVTTRAGQRGGGSGSPFDMFEEFFGIPQQRRGGQPRQAQASGSGVIISPDGYIVTNNHVVEDADKIEVQLTDNRTYEAKVIGRDPNFDLALIKVNATNLPMVKLGNSDDVQVGEWVLAVGYPLGLQSTVTAGIVSAKGRRIGILDDPSQQRGYSPRGPEEQMVSTAIESFIQTDAVINKGNSGGALVNARGELIGINSAIASPTGTYAGYGFAIPISLAKKVLDDFKEFGSVKRGYVGISFKEVGVVRKDYGIDDVNGLYVEEVVKGGGAESAGIKKGDIITRVDGKIIYGSPDLQERVARLRPGDKVKLTYKREGKEKEVVVTLKGEEVNKAAAKDEESSASATQIFNKLGASFIPATDARKKELGITSGVVVTQVHRGGVFEYFGVERGLVITEINGKSVNSVDDVESALASTKRNIVRIKGVPQRGSTVELNVPIEY